jgi:hypothetical protein
MNKLLSYYEGPVNYTLAGYNCKVLTTLFNKKPANVAIILFSLLIFFLNRKRITLSSFALT